MRVRKRKRKISASAEVPEEGDDPKFSSWRKPARPQTSSDQSPIPDDVSLKSNRSRDMPENFGITKPEWPQTSSHWPPIPDDVSLKSNRSRDMPENFGNTKPECWPPEEPLRCSACNEVFKDPVRFICGHSLCKRCLGDQSDSSAEPCPKCGKKLREEVEESHPLRASTRYKEKMRCKYTFTYEGVDDQKSSLNTIYTDLYILPVLGQWSDEEHEFRQLEHTLRTHKSPKYTVGLSDIFKPLPGKTMPHRLVLTKGIAGIGKSFAVQKFILEWAEGKENQDVVFVFCLALRELNLCRDEESFQDILTRFHAELCTTGSEDYTKTKVILILDGLDEGKLQLDFNKVKKVTSVTEKTSVGNLLVNLIQGNLLPSANIWITSRPAAANQIPPKYVDLVTEISGFNDTQKEEYFRRRFSPDLALADRVISHIQSSQSLSIMCRIPIFCWISALLFKEVFEADQEADIPQTMTEMMAHYLFAQTKRRSRKYDKKIEKNNERLMKMHREFLLKLGKLAFVHLRKNNLIFYEEDLEECGIDIKEASTYSGYCNTVLRDEELCSQIQVFFFVHLTIQEFFAALYVYDCFINRNTAELSDFLDLKDKDYTLPDLLKKTVDKVQEKTNGHLSYFMRFLLGLVVETNRRGLQGLLMSPDPSEDAERKILTYLRSIHRKGLCPDTCIILIQAMVEMRDQKVKDVITEYLTDADRPEAELIPLYCSVLAYMLLVSKHDLDVLDLKSYNTSEEGRRRLIPAVRRSKKGLLADCKMTPDWVQHLAFSLRFPNSSLSDLDLSNNDLRDSGVELLCDGLMSQCCRLKILRLSGCLVTEKGCRCLASALKSNPSHLRELDLSYNNPGDSGVKLLSELKEDPQYKLCTLNVEHGGSQWMKPGIKKYACELTLDPNTAHGNFLLSDGNTKVTWDEKKPQGGGPPEASYWCPLVLCEQALTGRHYWEVKVVEPLNTGVTYRPFEESGGASGCKLGCNDRSWSLICSDGGCFVLHDKERVDVSSQRSRSSRVGLYLDHPAGTLTFYRVASDSQVPLHTFKAAFGEPLHPAVQLRARSSALFC